MKFSAVLLRLPTHALIESSSSCVISFGRKPAAQSSSGFRQSSHAQNGEVIALSIGSSKVRGSQSRARPWHWEPSACGTKSRHSGWHMPPLIGAVRRRPTMASSDSE